MRLQAIGLVVLLALSTGTSFSQSNTVVVIKSGPWVMSDTWSCKCMPKRTDSIVIPQGIIVSVTHPLMLGPTENGKPLLISIAGTLSLASASIHIDPIDRVLIMPGGKVTTKSLGGGIFSGIYGVNLGGTTARGPATFGDDYAPTAISAITAEKDTKGVTISWRSGSEIEVNWYYVLRSSDGITYEQIGKVDGRGSLRQKLYSFVDESRPSGEVHYRLDLINNNGVGSTAAFMNATIGVVDDTVSVSAEEAPGQR